MQMLRQQTLSKRVSIQDEVSIWKYSDLLYKLKPKQLNHIKLQGNGVRKQDILELCKGPGTLDYLLGPGDLGPSLGSPWKSCQERYIDVETDVHCPECFQARGGAAHIFCFFSSPTPETLSVKTASLNSHMSVQRSRRSHDGSPCSGITRTTVMFWQKTTHEKDMVEKQAPQRDLLFSKWWTAT